MMYYHINKIPRNDSLRAVAMAVEKHSTSIRFYNKLPIEKKQAAVNTALSQVQSEVSDLEFKSMITSDGDKIIRQHKIEAINKFTLALSCLIFFSSVLHWAPSSEKEDSACLSSFPCWCSSCTTSLDNSGYRMARGGMWTVWFGKGLAPAVLIPIAVFVTYKANNDSMVFNFDL